MVDVFNGASLDAVAQARPDDGVAFRAIWARDCCRLTRYVRVDFGFDELIEDGASVIDPSELLEDRFHGKEAMLERDGMVAHQTQDATFGVVPGFKPVSLRVWGKDGVVLFSGSARSRTICALEVGPNARKVEGSVKEGISEGRSLYVMKVRHIRAIQERRTPLFVCAAELGAERGSRYCWDDSTV